ncbi:asparagine synthase [Microbacterium aquimaris]|uniref:asparagine synthase n=1 Tax=Microbacterium aquimaris TaxID=459816 RepID=UPI002AD5168E|nr:asparagine synthase [Microbacterium aquimaris]MDZ8276754.1 asparagine synthase [Microbacterium aquimaris]
MGRNADAIAEGVSIAAAAARLTVRNRILVDTIARNEPFDPERVAPFARETLLALATEQEAAADLARKQRKKAWGKYSDPGSTHDYRDRDTRNLRRRQRQYNGVAKVLRERADDPEAIDALVADARQAAWGDVESNLQRRLVAEGARPDLEPDYAKMRAARMQTLRLVDLPKLAAHRRRVGPSAVGTVEDPEDVAAALDSPPTET